MFIFSFCFCVNSTKTVNPLIRLIHNTRCMVKGLKSLYMHEITIQIFSDLLPPANLRRLCFYTCLSVILFTGRGVPGVPGGGASAPRGCLVLGGLLPVGCLVPGGAYSWGVSARGGTSAPRWGCLVPGGVCSGGLLLRAVRILLECILDNCHSFEDILSYCEESHFFTIQRFYLSL